MLQSNFGSYLIKFNLTDGNQLIPYNFTVNVLNNPPGWSASINIMSVALNSSISFLLPPVYDPDPGSSL